MVFVRLDEILSDLVINWSDDLLEHSSRIDTFPKVLDF